MLFKNNVPTEDLEYDEYSHGPIYRFFRAYSTYFIKLMSVNALFLVFNIPSMLIAFAFCLVFLPNFNSVFIPENFAQYIAELGITGNAAINDVGYDVAYQIYYLIFVVLVMFLIGSLLVCIGPLQSGFMTIFRNIARNQGAFMVNDFKDGVKKNWKMSLKNMFISLIFTAILMFGIGFYANHFGKFGQAASVFFTVIFCMFTVVQQIVNYLIVTIDLPLGKLYKNAVLFLFIKLFPYAGLFVLSIALLVVLPAILLFTTTFFGYAITIVFYFVFAFSFIQLAFAFLTNENVNLYILPKTEKFQAMMKEKLANQASESDDDDDDESDEDDEDNEDDEGAENENIDSQETNVSENENK